MREALADPIPCIACGAIFRPPKFQLSRGGAYGRHCSRQCWIQNGRKGPRTLKGRRVVDAGYVQLDGLNMEHRVIAERALGRRLPPKAVIHHVNEDKTDNRPANLVICPNQAFHVLLHARLRIVKRGYDPDLYKICGKCQRVLPFDGFHKNKANSSGVTGLCKQCILEWHRIARAARLAEKMGSEFANPTTATGSTIKK